MLERVMAVAAVGLVGVLLSACTGPAQERRPVELAEGAVLVAAAELEVGVQSCNGNPEITQLTRPTSRCGWRSPPRCSIRVTPAWT